MCVYVNMLHKHIFGFHKSDFVKCKLLINLEEKFIARKNRINNKKKSQKQPFGGVFQNRCS